LFRNANHEDAKKRQNNTVEGLMFNRSAQWIRVILALALAQGRVSGQTTDRMPSISEQVSAIEMTASRARDGRETAAAVRRPPGRSGPLPAVVLFHGGLDEWPVTRLKRAVLNQPLPAFFLAEGYVIVQATYRSRSEDPQSPKTLWDAVAMVEHVKQLPGVDPRSVVIWGTSGGGSLAFELAAEIEVAAIGVWEPGTIIFSGMLTRGNQVGKVLSPDPRRYWTPEIERRTQERLRRLSCPIFVGHGDVHPLKELNFKLFFPEMLRVGKPVQINVYPGMQHGIFYWYDKDRLPYIKSFFDDCNYMFKKYLATQPVPMDRSAIQWVPDSPANTILER
jgi:acetyl esterase/lipase